MTGPPGRDDPRRPAPHGREAGGRPPAPGPAPAPDLIGEWLGADVEPLPPPPGTFERIRHRARRRRAARLAGGLAGTALVVAGLLAVPRLAGDLLRDHAAGPDRVAAGGLRTPPAASPRRPASPLRSAAPHAAQGPPLAAGAGVPAAGFRPSSVTFVGPYHGAVLGQAGACPRACTALAGTADYGASWYRVGAPPAGPPRGPAGVSQVRFLDESNGWAYGPSLWATHDGGSRWAPVWLPGRVIDLAAAGDRAFAVVASCTGAGPGYAARCSSFALYSAAAASDAWRPVPGAAAPVPEAPGGLQLTQRRGFLLASGLLFTGPVAGGPWHRVAVRSPPPACLSPRPAGGRPAALIAPASQGIYLACLAAAAGRPALYLSRDGGRSWQAEGPITAAGSPTSLAVAPGGALVLATTAGLYYSADARTWHPAGLPGPSPPGGFGFVGMTTLSQGVAVPSDPGLHEIYRTLDGGITWQPSVIP